MKYILIIFLLGAVLHSQAQHPPQPVYRIGDSLSCGFVFNVINYDSSRFQRVLICAPTDLSIGQVAWYNGQYLVTNALIDQEFDRVNAQQVIAAQGNTGSYAALLCASYQPAILCPDTSADWYLPSRAELSLVYNNISSKGRGQFAPEGYWSSLEDSLLVPSTSPGQSDMTARRAWITDFYDGTTFPVDKANKYHIRPVKTFIARYQ